MFLTQINVEMFLPFYYIFLLHLSPKKQVVFCSFSSEIMFAARICLLRFLQHFLKLFWRINILSVESSVAGNILQIPHIVRRAADQFGTKKKKKCQRPEHAALLCGRHVYGTGALCGERRLERCLLGERAGGRRWLLDEENNFIKLPTPTLSSYLTPIIVKVSLWMQHGGILMEDPALLLPFLSNIPIYDVFISTAVPC